MKRIFIFPTIEEAKAFILTEPRDPVFVGGVGMAEIAADESKALGRQAWLEYMARLQKAGCRQMDTTDKGLMGFDGSQWIPGVNPNGQYLVIDRWRGCGIRELCLPLFRLT